MTEPPAATQADWNQPTDYERWYASSLGRAYAASLERILRPWLAAAPAEVVLDVGCGPGLAIERLFPKQWGVVGLDCSLDMARRALARSHRTIVVGSVEQIPFRDGRFDLAFCVNCLEFVEDREAAFREIARILRPAGTAILGVLNRHSIWEVTRRLHRPFSSRTYYRGRVLTTKDVQSCCTRAGLRIEDLKAAVHFPPFPPGPLEPAYERIDESLQHRSRPWGGVILCRATRR
jgi:SAM-dependent methyltransferase